MNAIGAEPTYTPDDLLAMPDGDRYELIDGRLVEITVGARASYIGGRLSYLIGGHVEVQGLGWVLGPDCGYRCFPDHPRTVRKPDVSFVRFGRLPGEEVPEGDIAIAPDLVAEVVSPNDLYYEVDRKVAEYLGAGVRLVWVVSPEARTVFIYRADGSIQALREHDELNGEDVLPGFRCRVGVIFRNPAAAEPGPGVPGKSDPEPYISS